MDLGISQYQKDITYNRATSTWATKLSIPITCVYGLGTCITWKWAGPCTVSIYIICRQPRYLHSIPLMPQAASSVNYLWWMIIGGIQIQINLEQEAEINFETQGDGWSEWCELWVRKRGRGHIISTNSPKAIYREEVDGATTWLWSTGLVIDQYHSNHIGCCGTWQGWHGTCQSIAVYSSHPTVSFSLSKFRILSQLAHFMGF